MPEPARTIRRDGSESLSHGEARGASKHGPTCSCARCSGFRPGNDHAVRHGGYARVPSTVVAEVVEEITEAMEQLGTYSPGFSLAVEGAAEVVAETRRAENAYKWLQGVITERTSSEHRSYLVSGESAKGIVSLREYVRRLRDSRKRHLEGLGLDARSAGALFRDAGIGRAAGARVRRSLPSPDPEINLDALKPQDLVELFAAIDAAAEEAAA